MAIDKKLIHFNTKDTFDQKKDQIKDTSIVFVKDANIIYTHGEEYQFIEWGYLGTVGSDGEESGGNLITFTVGNTQYQAEEGMTWGEWVDSEYNIYGFYIGNNYVRPDASSEVVDASNAAQYANTIILNNAAYRVVGGGASD